MYVSLNSEVSLLTRSIPDIVRPPPDRAKLESAINQIEEVFAVYMGSQQAAGMGQPASEECYIWQASEDSGQPASERVLC